MLTDANIECERESDGAEKSVDSKAEEDPSRIMENNKNQHYRRKCSRRICIFIRLKGKVLNFFPPLLNQVCRFPSHPKLFIYWVMIDTGYQ